MACITVGMYNNEPSFVEKMLGRLGMAVVMGAAILLLKACDVMP
ncbi:hypothetical protein [Hymenobacter sp. GOD-10R]|nr:hypothetical protein [Hymenobacter sp. GOD-10R]WRQ31948.1 hypothetical protein SD425_29485 [Hymenobacter sp. GOD-10R]